MAVALKKRRAKIRVVARIVPVFTEALERTKERVLFDPLVSII